MIEKILTEICRLKKDLEGYSAQEALDQIEAYINLISRKPPLPSDLDEAAEEYSRGLDYYHYTEDDPAIAFKAGAKWMQNQFEKNRLANCDKLTKEEYDRETDFALGIVENERRQPTFTDAISYGMRVQKEKDDAEQAELFTIVALDAAQRAKEQMMKEAVEGEVYQYQSYKRTATAILVDIPKEKLGEKVRIIVLPKED